MKAIMDPAIFDKACCNTLRLFFSYSEKVLISRTTGTDPQMEEDQDYPEDTMICEYFKACKALIGTQMVQKLVTKLKMKAHCTIQLSDNLDVSSNFLEIYRADNINSPDLIWNENTRREFISILEKEIRISEQGDNTWEVNPYEDFTYTDYEDELTIDNIHIRLLNKDIYYAIEDPDSFLVKLMEKLKENTSDKLLSFELLMALRNCIASTAVTE